MNNQQNYPRGGYRQPQQPQGGGNNKTPLYILLGVLAAVVVALAAMIGARYYKKSHAAPQPQQSTILAENTTAPQDEQPATEQPQEPAGAVSSGTGTGTGGRDLSTGSGFSIIETPAPADDNGRAGGDNKTDGKNNGGNNKAKQNPPDQPKTKKKSRSDNDITPAKPSQYERVKVTVSGQNSNVAFSGSGTMFVSEMEPDAVYFDLIYRYKGTNESYRFKGRMDPDSGYFTGKEFENEGQLQGQYRGKLTGNNGKQLTMQGNFNAGGKSYKSVMRVNM